MDKIKKKSLFLSVVMSAYNEKKEDIELSINSILKQEYQNFEFIIVLDNPENVELKELMYNYKLLDDRINIIINETNLGLSNSLNKAIDIASGDFIVRMDADDISKKNRLSVLTRVALNNSSIDIFFSRYSVIDENNTYIKSSLSMPENTYKIRRILKYKNIICHPTTMVRTSVIKREKYSNLPVSEDYELWVRLAKKNYKFQGINVDLLSYRIREDSMTTSDYYKSFFSLKFIWDYYKKNSPENIITSELFNYSYSKMSKNKCKYNKYAEEYFYVLNQMGKKKISIRNMVALFKIVILEPNILNFMYRTLMSTLIRRRYNGIN